MPGAAATAEPGPINIQGDVLAQGKRDNAEMDIEQLEQLAAVIVTAGLVAGNFLLFTPWRNGEDPRQRQPESLMPQNESVHQSELGSFKESFIRLMANRSRSMQGQELLIKARKNEINTFINQNSLRLLSRSGNERSIASSYSSSHWK